jgi:hypothetical protein
VASFCEEIKKGGAMSKYLFVMEKEDLLKKFDVLLSDSL